MMQKAALLRLAAVALVVGMASAAVAGGNPEVTIYVSFDPAGAPVHALEPQPYTTVNAYVCLGNIDEGVSAVALKLSNALMEYPAVVVTQSWVFLWPG